MEEQGLAAAMGGVGLGVGQAPKNSGSPAIKPAMVSVEELVMLLKQGITPEELAQNGVPVELINEAMKVIQQEAQSGQTQQPTEGGLADMYMAQGAV